MDKQFPVPSGTSRTFRNLNRTTLMMVFSCISLFLSSQISEEPAAGFMAGLLIAVLIKSVKATKEFKDELAQPQV